MKKRLPSGRAPESLVDRRSVERVFAALGMQYNPPAVARQPAAGGPRAGTGESSARGPAATAPSRSATFGAREEDDDVTGVTLNEQVTDE